MYTVAQIKTNCLNQLQVTYNGFISVLNNCNLATKHHNIIVLLTLTLYKNTAVRQHCCAYTVNHNVVRFAAMS